MSALARMETSVTKVPIETWFEIGKATYPRLAISPERFVAFLRDRFSESACENEIEVQHAAPDLYLCCGCVERIPEALAIFESELMPYARAAVGKLCDSQQGAEVLQAVRTKLLAGDGTTADIGSYLGRGSLRGFVQVSATRAALTALRGTQRAKKRHAELEIEDLLATADDPETRLLRQTYGQAFRNAVKEAAESLDSAERNLLRYHTIDQLNIDEIGEILGIHRATAARRLVRAKERLYDRVRETLKMRLGIGSLELSSVMRWVGSELDVSLSTVL